MLGAAWPRAFLWQTLFLVLGFLVLAALIHEVGLAAIFNVLEHLGWLTPLIVLPYLCSYLLDNIGWWWILRREFATLPGNPHRPPDMLQLFGMRAAGEAVNAITPTAYLGGEPLKAWLLQRYNIPFAPALASALVSKTALLLTQGCYVFIALLVALHRWWPAFPLFLAAAVGIAFGILAFRLMIGAQRRDLFGSLLAFLRRWSGRSALLAPLEADVHALDDFLREFYHSRLRDFSICCLFHFLGWVVGSLEVYLALWLLHHPVNLARAFAIDALSGVAKLGVIIVPGSLGVQEAGQILIFVAFGLTAPLAVTFGLLRRGRELLWIGYGLAVLIHHHAGSWLRERLQVWRSM